MKKFQRILAVMLALVMLFGTSVMDLGLTATVNAEENASTVVPNTGVLGDVTGDGKLNISDALRLAKYASKWDVDVNLYAVDTNGDGKLTIMDVLRLAKAVAGWTGEDAQLYYGTLDVLKGVVIDLTPENFVDDGGVDMDGVTFENGTVNTSNQIIGFKLPEPLPMGSKATVTIKGSSDGDFRFWLMALGQKTASDIWRASEHGFESGEFEYTVEFAVYDHDEVGSTYATSVAFKGPTWDTTLDNFTLTEIRVSYEIAEEPIEPIEPIDPVNPGTGDNQPEIGANGLEYTLAATGDFYYVTGVGTNGDSDLIIPGENNGLPVKIVRQNAFMVWEMNNQLSSVVFSEGIEIIEQYSFYEHENLTTVIFPSTLTKIDDCAFFGCGITQLNVPENVSYINGRAFMECPLESITVSEENTTFHAYNNCLIQDETVLLLACKDGVIPAYVTYVDSNAFAGIDLDYIQIEEGNEHYYAAGECLIEKETGRLVVGTNNSVIPDDGSVTAIGYNAFAGKHGITKLVIPGSVKIIESEAFYDTLNLETVVFNEGLVSIEYVAFSFCPNLSGEIYIPSTVEYVTGDSFSNCEGISGVVVSENNPKYHSVNNNVIETATKTLVWGSSVIPADGSVTSLGQGAYATNVESLIIPDCITYIDEWAFNGASAHYIYFCGTPEQWDAMMAATNPFNINQDRVYFYSESEPSETYRKYWYYDENGLPAAWNTEGPDEDVIFSDYFNGDTNGWTTHGGTGNVAVEDGMLLSYDRWNGAFSTGHDLGAFAAGSRYTVMLDLFAYPSDMDIDGAITYTVKLIDYSSEGELNGAAFDLPSLVEYYVTVPSGSMETFSFEFIPDSDISYVALAVSTSQHDPWNIAPDFYIDNVYVLGKYVERPDPNAEIVLISAEMTGSGTISILDEIDFNDESLFLKIYYDLLDEAYLGWGPCCIADSSWVGAISYDSGHGDILITNSKGYFLIPLTTIASAFEAIGSDPADGVVLNWWGEDALPTKVELVRKGAGTVGKTITELTPENCQTIANIPVAIQPFVQDNIDWAWNSVGEMVVGRFNETLKLNWNITSDSMSFNAENTADFTVDPTFALQIGNLEFLNLPVGADYGDWGTFKYTYTDITVTAEGYADVVIPASSFTADLKVERVPWGRGGDVIILDLVSSIKEQLELDTEGLVEYLKKVTSVSTTLTLISYNGFTMEDIIDYLGEEPAVNGTTITELSIENAKTIKNIPVLTQLFTQNLVNWSWVGLGDDYDSMFGIPTEYKWTDLKGTIIHSAETTNDFTTDPKFAIQMTNYDFLKLPDGAAVGDSGDWGTFTYSHSDIVITAEGYADVVIPANTITADLKVVKETWGNNGCGVTIDLISAIKKQLGLDTEGLVNYLLMVDSVSTTITLESYNSFTLADIHAYLDEHLPGWENMLDYALSEDGTYYTVVGVGTYSDSDLVIPETYNGLPVKEIGVGAFDGNTSFTSLTIPDSVVIIESFAFRSCTGIKSLTIGKNVKFIGGAAFNGCGGLESITVDPENMVYHDAGNCLIETASGLLITGSNYAVIPTDGSVTAIGHAAFRACEDLKSIYIPASVTSIDHYIVAGCRSLESITVDPANTVYHSVDNCLIETATGTLVTGCKNSVLPNDGSIKTIGVGAFCVCWDSDSMIIPEGVIEFGVYAFEGCPFKSISIPNSLTYIDDCAFSWCNLESIVIPNGVQYIGYHAFENCRNLSTITFVGTESEWNAITKGVDWDYNVGSNLGGYTVIFTEVEVPVTPEPGTVIWKEETSLFTSNTWSVYELGISVSEFVSLLQTPNAQLKITRSEPADISLDPDDGYEKFCITDLWYSFQYPTSSGEYLNHVALGTGNFSKVELENKGVYDSVHLDCIYDTGLVVAYDGSDLAEVINNANFDVNCSSMQLISNTSYTNYEILSLEIVIGSEIEPDVPVEVPQTLDYALSDTGDYYIVTGIGTYTDSTLVIPGEYNGLPVKEIGDSAFIGCMIFNSLQIPATVVNIGHQAFNWCSALKTIEVDPANTVYHSDGNCLIETATQTLKFGCMNSIIPDDGSVIIIDDAAFWGASELTNIYIPAQVVLINSNPFHQCANLEAITVDENNEVYHSFNNCLIETETKVLVTGCKNSVIPDDGSVAVIGDFAFGGCTDLENVIIPDGITEIDNLGFCFCGNIASVTIPKSTTIIGGNAFGYCYNLSTITFLGTEEEWNAITKHEQWDQEAGYNVGGYTVIFTEVEVPAEDM